MNLKSLPDQELHSKTRSLASDERKLTLEILHHLAEIERRMLYAQHNYSSLFDYCIQELHYSAAQSQRRISAMRLLREIPQIEKEVSDGLINLSQLAQVQTFLRTEKKETKNHYSPTQKLELVQAMTGLSTRDTERALKIKSPTYAEHVQTRTTARFITAGLTELKLVVDQNFLQLLEQARSACAHNRDMSPSPQELLKKGLELLLASQQKKRGIVTAAKAADSSVLAAPKALSTNRSRYIPAALKRKVATRALGRCEFIHPNGTRCDSSHAIEIHHIHAFAKGGANTTQNLRVYCRTHNALEGVNEFGRQGQPILSSSRHSEKNSD